MFIAEDYTEEKIKERISEIEDIEDQSLRECAIDFWHYLLCLLRITKAKFIKIKVVDEVDNHLYGSAFYLFNEKQGFISRILLKDFSPEFALAKTAH